MEQHPSYYTNIPAFVRYDEELLKKPKSILLYGEIVALSNQKGYCWARNSYFAERLKVSGRMIQDYLDILVTKGYVARKLIYKSHSKQVDKRILSIASRPGEADFMRGDEMDFVRPGEADFAENITSINNTSKNKDDDSTLVENPFNLARQANINVQSGLNLPVFTDYISRLGSELVCYAIRQTNEYASHPNWSYLQSVLKSLEDNKVKSVAEAEELSKKYGKQRQRTYPKKSQQTSTYKLPTKDEGMTQTEALKIMLAKEKEELQKEGVNIDDF